MVDKKTSSFEEYKYAMIVVGGTIIATLILIFLVAVPMWKSMQKTLSELSQEQKTLTALETKLSNLKGLADREKELKEQNAKVLAALPEDKDVSRLFVQFENVATSSGLTVKQVSEGTGTGTTNAATTTPANATIVPVSYQITATAPNYDSVKTALANFEKALRLVSVSTLDITSSGGADLNVNFSVTTYKRGAK